MILETVGAILESLGAPYALIGGRALALRGYPRLTIDYDFLTADRRVFEKSVWESLEASGTTIDIRFGDFDDPLAGVVHIQFDPEQDADVIVAKWSWEQGVIERAERMTVRGFSVPVPQTSDLILLKLAAGGFVDLQDVHTLLDVGDREQLIREVNERIEALDAGAHDAWTRILSSS